MPMLWLKKKRRLVDSPISIAALLHQIGAEEDNSEVAPEAFNLSKEAYASFHDKVFLYREAIILLALLTKVQHEPIFQDVLWEYERILFPESPETPAGAVRMQAIKTAMSDVRVLIDPDNKRPLSWGVRWFATIDHEENNPIKIFMLTTFFMSQYIAASKGLEKLVV